MGMLTELRAIQARRPIEPDLNDPKVRAVQEQIERDIARLHAGLPLEHRPGTFGANENAS
jgi:hypothetical protein